MSEQTKRITVPAAEEILGLYFPVLDHGFVSLVDYMGGDVAVEQAARVAYGLGTRKSSESRGLLRYLRRHRHCYAPEMEVLTCRGWVKWEECNAEEDFLVPNPTTRTLHKERLSLEVFGVDEEEMVCFNNHRLSFKVTGDHRMWFKKKFQGLAGTDGEKFEIVRASEMSKWGHFDSAGGYSLYSSEGPKDPEFQFTGFYLGDGSYASTNRVSFHLRKERKKIYLRTLLAKLGISYTEKPSNTYEDALVFYVEIPDFLRRNLGGLLPARSLDKGFPLERLVELGEDSIRGLWEGLVESDGSKKNDRSQINYSSASKNLRSLFETTSAMLGIPAHVVGDGTMVNAITEGSTEIESRKSFFTTEHLTGKVYCATSSTGLLMVRGGSDKFGFVCGNTSPSEMVEFKFHCSMPIFVARQWIRHRTANVNELSGRYSVLPMLFYTPSEDQLRPQSKINKQGRSEDALSNDNKKTAYDMWKSQRTLAMDNYQWLNEHDFARELARIDLPLSTYTQWYWKIDLHNLLHFLTLRVDAHAQWEIQQYGIKMAAMLKRVAPISYEAWIDYEVCGVSMSRMEMVMIRHMLAGELAAENPPNCGLTDREMDEFLESLKPRETPDFNLDLNEAKDATYFEAQSFAAAPGK
jgi:thymidylate synthase (FAD)